MPTSPSATRPQLPTRRRLTPPRPVRRASSRPPRAVQAPVARLPLPAALPWQDASLPILGRVRAAGWLPTTLLAVCAVALVYLVQTSGVAATGYDIQQLQADRSEWQLRNEQLKLELSKLRSLPWIEAEAVNRLGMQPPEWLTYLAVEARPAPR